MTIMNVNAERQFGHPCYVIVNKSDKKYLSIRCSHCKRDGQVKIFFTKYEHNEFKLNKRNQHRLKIKHDSSKHKKNVVSPMSPENLTTADY